MGNEVKKILTNPLVWVGIFVKLTFIFLYIPDAPKQWYLPFLSFSIKNFSTDPWLSWLASGGDLVAFPYGYVEWFIFLPLMIMCKFLNANAWFAYSGTLLLVDFSLLFILNKLWQDKFAYLVALYWLSPIVIFGTYVLGYNDLIPIFFVILSLLFLKEKRFYFSGFILAMAISAKISMIVSVPFFLIYLFNRRSIRKKLNNFIFGVISSGMIFIFPFIFSKSAIFMLIENPEIKKIYSFAIHLGENFNIYLIPVVYCLMLYVFWNCKKINFDALLTLLGLSFFILFLLTPASFGWLIWAIPFLVFYQLKRGKSAIFIVNCLIISCITLSLIKSEIHEDDIFLFGNGLIEQSIIFLQTIIFASGIAIIIKVWTQLILEDEFFQQSRQVFSIGVVGDSGVGKDTLASSIIGLFGVHSVAHISGDDYHFWDRQKPMWQVMTHLNPMANNLEKFLSDVRRLCRGMPVSIRHYDHQIGKYRSISNLSSNDFILATGLHTLYLPLLREIFDLKIYLDMDDDLRKFLKIKRDVYERGHSKEAILNIFEERKNDAKKFIHTQSKYADLYLSVQLASVYGENIENFEDLKLKLIVKSKLHASESAIAKVLIAVCGLHVDMNLSSEDQTGELMIEGDVRGEDISLAAQTLCPEILEFLDSEPKWLDGIHGVIQLIILVHINQSLNRKILS